MMLKPLRLLQSSLSGKILLLFLGFWTVGAVGLGYFFSRHLENTLVESTEDVAALTLKNLEHQQDALKNAAHWMADKPELINSVELGDRDGLARTLLPMQSSLKLCAVQVVQPNQDILAQVQAVEPPDRQDAANQAFYQAASAGTEGTSTLNRPNLPMQFAASVAIQSRNQRVANLVIATTLDHKRLERARASNAHHLVVMHGDRMTASTLSESAAKATWNPPALDGSPTWVSIEQMPYIAKSIAIPASTGSNARLVLLTPANSIQQAQRQIWILTGLFCVMGLGTAAVAGKFLANMLTQRIKRLTDATQQLAAGDLSIRLPVNGQDEVSQLGQSFNQMSEQLVLRDRTIQAQMEQLQTTLHTLQQTQSQLIQSEKMSGLGQLVSGVSHEINNPVGFIHSNLGHAKQYVQDLLNLVELYSKEQPEPSSAVQTAVEAIELPFLQTDVMKLFASMENGTARIQEIVGSLRNFARLDESGLKAVNLEEGLESTLLLLQYQLRPQVDRAEIQVVRNYALLPLVNCYPGTLNQVLMHLLSNAIEAVEQVAQPEIRINLKLQGESAIAITIADNGCGIDPSAASKVFDPFFTTKPIGQGTGMGLAISHQIITVQHHGQITVDSQPGQGSSFTITLPMDLA